MDKIPVENHVTTKSRTRVLAAASLFVLLTAAGAFTWRIHAAGPRGDSMVVVGKALPRLIVRDGGKNRVDLRTVKPGVRRIVAFYSPSCEVCQRELPELTPFPSSLALVMVNEGQTAVADPFLSSTDGAARFSDPDAAFRTAFKLPALPTLLFVDERNIVVDGLVGAHAPAVAQAKLNAFARGRV